LEGIVAHVRARAKLTHTEEAVVLTVLLGAPEGTLRDGRRIKITTIRSHQRRIRRKTGFRSMRALELAIFRQYFGGLGLV
jgi:DNA-binding CsgD family transcriptional regulator